MQKLNEIHLVRWKGFRARPLTKVYIRRNYAESFYQGLIRMSGRAEMHSFKVGDTVQLTDIARLSHRCPKGRNNFATARIQAFLSDTEGGVFLDRDLKGCRYWNVEDLNKPR